MWYRYINRQSEKAAWKEEVRGQFRKEIRKVLEHDYSFYPMRSRGVVLDDYMNQHFRQLNGKVFTPFQDRSILTLALHTPNGRNLLTSEQAELVKMLKADFDIDENYTLGAEPQLPPPTGLQFLVLEWSIQMFYVIVAMIQKNGLALHLVLVLTWHLGFDSKRLCSPIFAAIR